MNNKNIAKLFLILSLFFGTILVFLVPAFNSPDEDSHFLYAYHISNGEFLPSVKNNISGFYDPVSISEDIKENKKIIDHRDMKYSYDQMYDDQLLSQNYEEKSFSDSVVKSSPKLAYLAPAIGIKIAMLLPAFSGNDQNNTEVLLQFARFFSLLIYSIIGYYAIKITPKFKKSFFVVLLMPLSLFLRSMVTYDGILLVSTALVLANIIRLIDDKDYKFTKKDLIMFVILGFILFNVKMVYSIVFLGLFAVKEEKFENKKNKIKSIILIIFFVLLLTLIKQIPYTFINASSNNELASKQISHILAHPLGYLKTLIINIIVQVKAQNYWMIGTLGYLDTYMPVLFVFLFEIFMFTIFFIDSFYEDIKFPLWLKVGYLILIIFDIFGMYTLMYISWTPKVTNVIGGTEITGIQGRYFLPFLLLVPIIFSNKLLMKNKKSKIKQLLDKCKKFFEENFHYVTVMGLVLMILILFMRYYC